MRAIFSAASAALLLLSTTVTAERAPHAVAKHAKTAGCKGTEVTVLNGQAGRTICLASPVDSKRAHAHGAVIHNGNQVHTRVFNAANHSAGRGRNLSPVVNGIVTGATNGSQSKPVVIGISSSAAAGSKPVVLNIASSGSSSKTVVLGVSSTGFQTAGTVEPVATSVSPRPAKRAPYRPAALDAQ